MDHSQQPSFTPGELEDSLREQSYGLKSYRLVKKSALESTAEVITLEDDTVTVILTQRGYQIQRNTSEGEGLTYETVEDALQVISPLYVQAKQRLLVEKLSFPLRCHRAR